MKARELRIPLLILLVTVVVMAKVNNLQRWGGFKEKATSKANINSTLHFFIQSYNNASNDTYLFKVQKIIQSQMQLTTGVEYLVTVKIGRTKCKKNKMKKASCPLQSSELKKVTEDCLIIFSVLLSLIVLFYVALSFFVQMSLICTSLIYSVPWMNHYQLWNNSCQES